MMDEIINKIGEDAPANAVAHGGVDMAPNAGKKKKKQEKMPTLGDKLKENNDNNNVALRAWINKVDIVDQIIDDFHGKKQEEITVEPEPEKEYKGFKSKYNA